MKLPLFDLMPGLAGSASVVGETPPNSEDDPPHDKRDQRKRERRTAAEAQRDCKSG